MNKNNTESDFLKKYEDPTYIDELKTQKIEHLKNLLSKYENGEISEDELNKGLRVQEINHEMGFNDKLNELNLENLKGKKDPLDESNLNKILPSIRIQYIRTWKKFIENGKEDQTQAKEMEKVISKFDKILEEKQKRDQKSRVFKSLIWFFGIETLLVFIIVAFNHKFDLKIPDTTLQILVGATISQVAIMLGTVVYNLYPKEDIEKSFLDFEKIDKMRNEIK